MAFSFLDFLTLIGALGFFIYGMKVMSEGIQKVAGNKMREILSAMTRNRFLGVFTGFLITCLIQSSSATTVMVVSFVNAGLLSLVESIGVVMGANIGTTITAWLISIFGFKVQIASIALPIIAIGFPLLFFSKSKPKAWAEVLIGFALLFLGLNELKNSVPDLQNNPQVLEFISAYADLGFLSLLIAVGIGTVLTLIVQSSSAAMALTLVMCDQGWIPFEMAAGMILGENIGTTITANLAAMIANIHAKRAARAHFVFNILGVIWMLILYKPFIHGIDTYMLSTFGSAPTEDQHAIPIALSVFHSSFNIINVLLFIWFVPLIAKTVIKIVPSRGEVDEQYHLDYIETGLMGTAELSIMEAQKEVARMGELTRKMARFVPTLIQEKDYKASNKLLAKIGKYEEITDRVEVEIGDYLLKISTEELSEKSSLNVRSMLSIIGELERMGDIVYQMSKSIERKKEEKSWFTPEQRDNLIEMYNILDEAFDEMEQNLNREYGQVVIDKAKEFEIRINKYRDKLRREHLDSIEKGDYNIKSGIVYTDLFSSCEKLGDHIKNVSDSITGVL